MHLPQQLLHVARRDYLYICNMQTVYCTCHYWQSAVRAQALPEDGRLVACDRDAGSLAIARRAWDAAGVGHKACSSTPDQLANCFAWGHGGHGALAVPRDWTYAGLFRY